MMDIKSYVNILDIYYTSNGEILKQNQKVLKSGIILTTTYDDIFNVKLPKQKFYNQCNKSNINQSNPKSSESTASNTNSSKFGYCKKRFLLFIILVILLPLAGVVLFSFCNIFNASEDISSSKNYPVMNFDLCDQTNSYRDSSWFTPAPSDFFSCDVPIQISEIFMEELIYPRGTTMNCLSKLECMTFLGFYFINNSHQSKYNFFLDYKGNVYEARGWLCPYLSGQLWVGVIADGYSPNGETEEMKRILKHFNTEIVNYAVKCGFLSIGSFNRTILI